MLEGLDKYNKLLQEDSENPELTTKRLASGEWVANLPLQGMSGIGNTESEAINDVLKEFKKHETKAQTTTTAQ